MDEGDVMCIRGMGFNQLSWVQNMLKHSVMAYQMSGIISKQSSHGPLSSDCLPLNKIKTKTRTPGIANVSWLVSPSTNVARPFIDSQLVMQPIEYHCRTRSKAHNCVG